MHARRLLFVLSCWAAPSATTGISFWRNPQTLSQEKAVEKEFRLYTPWAGEEEEDTRGVDKVLPALSAIGTTLYGTALLCFSKEYPGQIHVITMLRATGFDKIEKAVEKARQNIRDATWSVVWNSPSFYRAKRNYRTSHERISQLKKIMEETKKAKADGVITPKEARRLQRLRKREIAQYRHEMKSFVRAAASFRKVFEALDLDEIRDIMRGFFFQMMAVLATGHNESIIGKVISKWCLFLNLGGLLLDTNAKLRYPISRLLHTRSLRSATIDEKKARTIELTGQAIMFSSAGYLVLNHNETSRDLNAALVSSAIIFRGIRSLVETFWDKADDEPTVWSTGGGFLQGSSGGAMMIALTSVGLFCRNRAKQGKFWSPDWICFTPFSMAEETINRAVLVLDKIM